MKLSSKKIKLASLLVFCGFGIVFLTTNRNYITVTKAEINGAPAARTGAPGEQTCTSCHSQAAGSGQFTITAPTTYTPGQTYSIQVKHVATDTTRRRWGFELTSLANNLTAGTLANSNANTKIIAANSRTYMTHSTAGTFQNQASGATWSFNWTAPTTNVGPVTFYAAGIQANNNGNESGDQTYVRTATIQPLVPTTIVLHHVYSDFDGDGKSDASIFRPSDGNWYINRSLDNSYYSVAFGTTVDKIAPADYDGDDKTDIAVWREGLPTVAAFYILESTTNTVRIDQFGQTGDMSNVVGDYDGDGKADVAVFRNGAGSNSQSYLYYRGSLSNPNRDITYVPWGMGGDAPMKGDFDGDGKYDAAVYRPSDQIWYIKNSSNGQMRVDSWGLPSDKFVPGDYDGDGKTDLAVFRGGIWYIKQSSNGIPVYYNWGISTDSLVPADYDGDGKTDIGVYRSGTWYVFKSSNSSMSAQVFGSASDSAVPNAYVQ
jgi:FG-GAP-like repeat/FG-GAP repeat/Reeler domain